jgi:hypothetical protein
VPVLAIFRGQILMFKKGVLKEKKNLRKLGHTWQRSFEAVLQHEARL